MTLKQANSLIGFWDNYRLLMSELGNVPSREYRWRCGCKVICHVGSEHEAVVISCDKHDAVLVGDETDGIPGEVRAAIVSKFMENKV